MNVTQSFKARSNDFKQHGQDDEMTPSTSSSLMPSRRSQRPSSQKRLLMNENSIDADEMDLALTLAFPSNMGNMKKYTDEIWRETLSSDCDSPSISIWEKQPETQTPAIVWPSTSTHGLCSPPKNHFYGEDIWPNVMAGNIFFPTSAPSSSSINKPSAEVKHRKKTSNVKPSTSDFDEDFNNMKKRLSLSSLRTSLCRQRAVENLNNGNAANASSSRTNASDDDFLQVLL